MLVLVQPLKKGVTSQACLFCLEAMRCVCTVLYCAMGRCVDTAKLSRNVYTNVCYIPYMEMLFVAMKTVPCVLFSNELTEFR